METLVVLAVFAFIFFGLPLLFNLPDMRREREEQAKIQEILQGFDIKKERLKIINMLEQTLPDGYRCRKKGCGGILLKSGRLFRGEYKSSSGYICLKCGNRRLTASAKGLRERNGTNI